MAEKKNLVHCRYPKCKYLHDSTNLLKSDAVQGGDKLFYYHPDCYHTMQSITKIRDLFVQHINPLMTSKQIATLVSTINNIVFNKGVDVDFLLFTVEYFINNKPGALKHPYGLHYIIQDKDVAAAWKKKQDKQIRQRMKEEIEKQAKKQAESVGDELNLDNNTGFVYKPNNKSKFTSILGV